LLWLEVETEELGLRYVGNFLEEEVVVPEEGSFFGRRFL